MSQSVESKSGGNGSTYLNPDSTLILSETPVQVSSLSISPKTERDLSYSKREHAGEGEGMEPWRRQASSTSP